MRVFYAVTNQAGVFVGAKVLDDSQLQRFLRAVAARGYVATQIDEARRKLVAAYDSPNTTISFNRETGVVTVDDRRPIIRCLTPGGAPIIEAAVAVSATPRLLRMETLNNAGNRANFNGSLQVGLGTIYEEAHGVPAPVQFTAGLGQMPVQRTVAIAYGDAGLWRTDTYRVWHSDPQVMARNAGIFHLTIS